MIRGALWFAAGAAVLIFAGVLTSAGGSSLLLYGALALGLYLASLGVERMIGAWMLARKTGTTAGGEGLGLTGLAAIALIIIVATAGYGAYRWRKPYWEAVSSLNTGNEAAAKLKAIAQRHAALMESSASGQAALASWKESAAQALALKPEFARALQGARTLAAGEGAVAARAAQDARFFELCLEWMDLYDRVALAVGEESMGGPPEEWTETQNDIVERIRVLQHPDG